MISDVKTVYDLIVGIGSHILKATHKKRLVVSFDHITVSRHYDEGAITPASVWHTPFGMQSTHHFEFGLSDPVLDVTLVNHHATPSLLTSIGVEVVSLAQFWWIPEFVEDFESSKETHIQYVGAAGALPRTEAVPIRDRIVVVIPDSWQPLRQEGIVRFASKPDDLRLLGISHIGEVIWSELRDPLLMDVNAPVRFFIHLDGYLRRMPAYSMIRLRARANTGDSSSEPIFIWIRSGVHAFAESLRMARQKSNCFDQRQAAANLMEAARHFYDSERKVASDFINYIGFRCFYENLYEESLWFFRDALKLRENCLPQDDIDVAVSLSNTAASLRELGNYADAEDLYRRSISMLERLGANDDLAVVLGFYAKLLRRTNRESEADQAIKRANSLMASKNGE